MTESSTSGSTEVQRAARTEWRSTPPMPIVQATSFTTLDSGFEQRLATRGRPLFLEPLGHQLRPDGPSGVVADLAQPRSHLAAGRPVQRSFAPALGSVATRMTHAEPVPPAPAIGVGILPDPGDITPNAHDITPNAPALPARRLVQAAPPDLPTVHLPVVARTPAGDPPAGPVAEHVGDSDTDADTDTDTDAPTSSMVPLVAQRSALDETRPTPPPVPEGTAGADGSRPVSGEGTGPSRAFHSSPPVVRIGEAIPSRPVAQRVAETSRPASAGPKGSIDAAGAQSPVTPAASSPSTHATSPMVGSRPAIGGDQSTGNTTAGPTLQDDVATVALPLVGRQILDSTPVAAHTSPAGPFPAVTAAAARGAATRRATIGEPLSGGAPGPVVQATTDPDSSAPIDRVTIPTLGETPPLLTPLDGAPATAGLAGMPVERATLGRGPSASHGVSGAVAVAASIQRAPTAPASASVGATVTVPAGTGPVITPANDAPEVSAMGRVGVPPGPVVARRLARTTEPVTVGRPVDTSNTLGVPRPDGSGDGVTSTHVVQLLASRPLSITFDGPGAPPDASRWSQEAATSDRASSSAGAFGAPAAPSTVQRAVGAGRVPAVVPQATTASQPVASPATDRPTGFVALDDGTVVEWAHDAPEPDGPVAIQRQAVPDTGPAGDAEAATGGGTATTTAVATVGPAAPAAPAPPRSEAELQELCRALYVPLRRRLCRDLLLDRERAGYRTDIRF